MKLIAYKSIKAYFTKFIADYIKPFGYKNHRKISGIPKDIVMQLVYEENSPNDHILNFEGGPTYFEMFYVRDLLRKESFPKPEYFVICAGAINSWDKCKVKWEDVLNFLKSNGYEIKDA